MSSPTLSVAESFTRHPGPRYVRQGPDSGERFRKVLIDWLARYDRFVVDLDGTSGFGSSFLDEAFGGLIRSEGMARSDVLRRISIKSTLDESYIHEVRSSINLAVPANAGARVLSVASS